MIKEMSRSLVSRVLLAPACLLTVLATTPLAAAEVTVDLVVKGYSDLFKSCEFSLGFDAPPDHVRVVLGYEIHVRNEKKSDCKSVWTNDGYVNTDCLSPPNAPESKSCDDLTKVRPVTLDCYDAAGKNLGCTRLTITGPDFFQFD